MEFEIGKTYVVRLGRKHKHSVIEATYEGEHIEPNGPGDYHVVKCVKIREWFGDALARKLAENHLCYIVGGEQIIKEVK